MRNLAVTPQEKADDETLFVFAKVLREDKFEPGEVQARIETRQLFFDNGYNPTAVAEQDRNAVAAFDALTNAEKIEALAGPGAFMATPLTRGGLSVLFNKVLLERFTQLESATGNASAAELTRNGTTFGYVVSDRLSTRPEYYDCHLEPLGVIERGDDAGVVTHKVVPAQ
jgi:hypothetical protein